jgi:hypothetical protein
LIKYLWNKRAKYKYIRNVERLINEWIHFRKRAKQ